VSTVETSSFQSKRILCKNGLHIPTQRNVNTEAENGEFKNYWDSDSLFSENNKKHQCLVCLKAVGAREIIMKHHNKTYKGCL
jgi:hypothetical protein